MEKRQLKYPPSIELGLKLFGYIMLITFFIIFISNGVLLAKHFFFGTSVSENSTPILCSSAFGIVLFSLILNAFPNVQVAGDGLLIDFFWTRGFIRWDQIGRIEKIQTRRKLYQAWAVEAETLTPFHLAYGLFTIIKPRRCFIVWSILPEYQWLFQEIYKNHRIKKGNKT